jgi:hypothetical protein
MTGQAWHCRLGQGGQTGPLSVITGGVGVVAATEGAAGAVSPNGGAYWVLYKRDSSWRLSPWSRILRRKEFHRLRAVEPPVRRWRLRR